MTDELGGSLRPVIYNVLWLPSSSGTNQRRAEGPRGAGVSNPTGIRTRCVTFKGRGFAKKAEYENGGSRVDARGGESALGGTG